LGEKLRRSPGNGILRTIINFERRNRMSEATIQVDGMSCQHCVMRVKKAVESLPGVTDLAVEVGLVRATFDESRVQKKEIEEAIVKAGYKIKG
jgi:copper chaperone